MDSLQLQLCSIQGRLFERATKYVYNSADFIKLFMNSETAKALDSTYNRMQWMGEEYLLEEVMSEAKGELDCRSESDLYDVDVMYWIGYTYRYWHYYTKESSSKIYKQAPAKTMKRNYMMFHTLSMEGAIERLKEIACQK